jgi:hypothetical protein
MTQITFFDEAISAAVGPLTEAQRRVFTAELRSLFPGDASETAIDRDTATERAWNVACSKLLSDPLDPIGEAWSRFVGSLFAGR